MNVTKNKLFTYEESLLNSQTFEKRQIHHIYEEFVSIIIPMNNRDQSITHVKNLYQIITDMKN